MIYLNLENDIPSIDYAENKQSDINSSKMLPLPVHKRFQKLEFLLCQ